MSSVKLSGVKFSQESNCPPTWAVSNCPRCQIIRDPPDYLIRWLIDHFPNLQKYLKLCLSWAMLNYLHSFLCGQSGPAWICWFGFTMCLVLHQMQIKQFSIIQEWYCGCNSQVGILLHFISDIKEAHLVKTTWGACVGGTLALECVIKGLAGWVVHTPLGHRPGNPTFASATTTSSNAAAAANLKFRLNGAFAKPFRSNYAVRLFQRILDFQIQQGSLPQIFSWSSKSFAWWLKQQANKQCSWSF